MKKILPLAGIKRGRTLLIAALFVFFAFSAGTFAPSVMAAAVDPGGGPGTEQAVQEVDVSENWIVKDIQLLVNFLAVGVGIIVIGVIIYGGISYAAAGDKPEAVAAAKRWIINGLIALLAYIFTFAFLQWIVPGGVF